MLFACIVAAIIDGDTLHCQSGTRVRLWGLDAPETSERGGAASTASLRAIAPRGTHLVCEHKGRSYDRIVGRCTVGRVDLTCAQIARGAGVEWLRYSGGFYRNC